MRHLLTATVLTLSLLAAQGAFAAAPAAPAAAAGAAAAAPAAAPAGDVTPEKKAQEECTASSQKQLEQADSETANFTELYTQCMNERGFEVKAEEGVEDGDYAAPAATAPAAPATAPAAPAKK